MIYLITTIHVLVCAFLIIVVLLQHGQSADIAAAFGGAGSQTAFGARTAGTMLSRGNHLRRHRFHGDVDHAVGDGNAPRRQ